MLDFTTAKQAVNNRFKAKLYSSDTPADYEVLIVGAGIAGISMACHLQQQSSQKRHHGQVAVNNGRR